MTTACGSGTSKQDMQKTLSLEEAPFWKYLEILRKEGYVEEADISETFYVTTLTQFGYTESQVRKTSFQNLVKAVEKIYEEATQEVNNMMNFVSVSGPLMKGGGADKLSEKQLQQLLRRQLQLHEEEKLRLST